jgi:hypothetical protein
VPHVDGDHDRLVVTLRGVGASRGWHDDTVDVTAVTGVELAGHPADDVDCKVVPAKEPVGAEAGNLLARVALAFISAKVTLSRRHFSPSTSIGVISSVTNPRQV